MFGGTALLCPQKSSPCHIFHRFMQEKVSTGCFPSLRRAFYHPKDSQCYWGFSEFLGSTAPRLRATYREVWSLSSVFIISLRRRCWRSAYLLFNSIFSVSVFLYVMWGREEQIKAIEEIVSNFLWVFITNLPCHVVNFQSSIRVSYGYSI